MQFVFLKLLQLLNWMDVLSIELMNSAIEYGNSHRSCILNSASTESLI
jgi:hypothetical protein